MDRSDRLFAGLVTAMEPTSPAGRRRHWEMLLLSLIAVLLSFLLVIRPDGRVAVRGLPRMAMPGTCLSQSVFGIDCPACGLTRAFISLAQGDLAASLAYHRLGWLMALAVVIQIPYRAACLLSGRSLRRAATKTFGLTLIAALLLQWLLLPASHH